MSKYVYGIDLGTTYSCIAYQDEDGRPTVVKNLDTNSDTTPSVVQFDEDGNVIVGEEAKDTSVLAPDRTAMFVKQLMGKSDIALEVDGKNYSPIEISSLILKELARQAKEQLDDDVRDVIITCPAYFGESERTATKQAGQLAGLNVLAVIEEPTAAAICYGVTRADAAKTVMVYDLGGGTFDITVLKISDGEVRVVTTEGDHELGGKKWDEQMSQLLVDKFVDATGYDGDPFDDDDNEEFLQDLAVKSEKAKQTLSNRDTVKQMLSYNGAGPAKVEVSRQEFEDATKFLADSALSLADKAVATAGGIDKIDEILLVGGSTKMPQIKEGVKEHFGIEPKMFDPDEAVAKGAAIFAMLQADEQSKLAANEEKQIDESGQEVAVNTETGEKRVLPTLSGGGSAMPTLGGGAPKLRVVSVSTKSFGVKATDAEDMQEKIINMIKKDDEIPVSVTQTFGTQDDNQPVVEIRIYQTPDKVDDYPVDEDRFLGTAELMLEPNTPAHSPISVTLELTPEGTVKMHAKDERSGKEIDAHWKPENVLDEKQFEEAKARVEATGLSV
ncbi:Hsp70 family protein [uncultured Bifidobacterium sp.]|uniref:Hsp70 family protein n=1 Tax=uncultured Bifidobacterium sp. TaxID=165187 RepID=UPI0025894685|nr:Hsp70 family protein [uncultured Bifidobacterium sp.]